MLNYDNYKSTLPYPEGLLTVRRNIKNLEKSLDDISNPEAIINEINILKVKLAELEAQEKAYSQERNALRNQWQKDLYAEYDVPNNPKADKAFGLAWEYGHANGLHEVEIYFADIVELIK